MVEKQNKKNILSVKIGDFFLFNIFAILGIICDRNNRKKLIHTVLVKTFQPLNIGENKSVSINSGREIDGKERKIGNPCATYLIVHTKKYTRQCTSTIVFFSSSLNTNFDFEMIIFGFVGL